MTDERQRTRDAFERADAGFEPSMDRLMETVPEIVGEARRRRAAASIAEPGLLQSLVPLAWKAVPGLGATAALLLAVSAVLFFTADQSVATAQGGESSELEQLILTGSPTGSDPLLEVIVGTEDAG